MKKWYWIAIFVLGFGLSYLSKFLWDSYIDSRIERKFIVSHERNAQIFLNKKTPWNNYTIEEKMYLCAYGSSGNKLNENDMKEIEGKYGQ